MRRELLVFLLFSLILTGCSCGKTSFTPSKEIQNNAEQAISDYCREEWSSGPVADQGYRNV